MSKIQQDFAIPHCLGLLWKTVSWEVAVLEVILKRFDMPDEVRTFDKGRFELVQDPGRK